MWIHVSPNRQTNFNSKNGRKRSFCYVNKASISFIPMCRMYLWCPIMKKRAYYVIRVYPNWKRNFNSKYGRKRSFLWNQSFNIIYPNDENVSRVPTHEEKGDYYVNRVCPNQWMNFNSKNGRKRSFSY